MKTTIHERCPRCGARNAWLEGGKVRVAHNCPKGPPGPADPPMVYHAEDVVLKRGDWTKDDLRRELDEAFAKIRKMRTSLGVQTFFLDQMTEALGSHRAMIDEALREG